MHEDVKLDLARMFFKTTIAVFMIATVAVLLFWICAILIVAGFLDITSFDGLMQVIQSKICDKPY